MALGTGTLSFANATTSQTFNGVTIKSGTSVITNTNAGATSTLTLGTITRATGGVVDFSSAASASNEVISSNANTNGILGGWATQGGEATWAVAGNGAAITGLSTYQPNTSTSLGASIFGNTDMTVSGTTTLTPGFGSIATTNSLRFNNAAADTIALTGQMFITSGGILETSNVGANANTISGGEQFWSGTGELVVFRTTASWPA